MNEWPSTKTPEKEPTPRDVTQEFLTMHPILFATDFMSQLKNEPSLLVKIDWMGPDQAKRLKGWIENMEAKRRGQKRVAIIRATEEQQNEALNVFASGVKWEKID